MQHRIGGLNAKWRAAGIEYPFRVRMGINTGFCNVGNFGSSDRMDYTIIGAEANLAARLQSNAEPGQIVLSYETYVLVRDIVVAQAQPPIMMKGISREIVPYAVRGTLDAAGEKIEIFREHMAGLDLYLNPSMVNTNHAEHIRTVLQEALKALERNGARAAAASVEAPR
jgi:citrate lyase gamma subunit